MQRRRAEPPRCRKRCQKPGKCTAHGRVRIVRFLFQEAEADRNPGQGTPPICAWLGVEPGISPRPTHPAAGLMAADVMIRQSPLSDGGASCIEAAAEFPALPGPQPTLAVYDPSKNLERQRRSPLGESLPPGCLLTCPGVSGFVCGRWSATASTGSSCTRCWQSSGGKTSSRRNTH